MAIGQPIGDALASGTTNGNTLAERDGSPPESEEREISLDAGTALVSGKVYAIMYESTGPDSLESDFKVSAPFYSDGKFWFSADAGVTWSSEPVYDRDRWFQTKASGVVKDSYTNAATNGGAVTEPGTDNLWSQTFTATSNYTITSIVLKLGRYSGESPGTVTIEIKDTLNVPIKAKTPAPTDAATDVTLDQATISWVDGGAATSYDVYYGDTSGSLSLVSSAQAGTSFTVTGITGGSPYSYLSTRYWRIDSTNAAGTTEGDEWSFTTIKFQPPGPTRYDSATGKYYIGDTEVYNPNFIATTRKLVAAADNKIWFEDV